MEDVVEASKIAGLDEFLGKMPGGYELVLQDKGNGLSGGQKQAIAITRAIVHKPSHFILDEPTSAMDMNSELNFINNFKEVVKDSTLIVVSHRMPLLNLVDRVLVMNEGKIVEDGPRDEVLEKLQPKKLIMADKPFLRNLLDTPKADFLLYTITSFFVLFFIWASISELEEVTKVMARS